MKEIHIFMENILHLENFNLCESSNFSIWGVSKTKIIQILVNWNHTGKERISKSKNRGFDNQNRARLWIKFLKFYFFKDVVQGKS